MVLPITTVETSLLANLIAFTTFIVATVGSFVTLWLAVDGSIKLSQMNSEFKLGALGRSGQIRLDESSLFNPTSMLVLHDGTQFQSTTV